MRVGAPQSPPALWRPRVAGRAEWLVKTRSPGRGRAKVASEVTSRVPLYEYQCPKCGRFELIQKFSDTPLATCPTCGSEVQKLPSAPAIQFKGTGWYITDYARKSEGKKEDGGKADAGKAEGSKEGGKESAAPAGESKASTASNGTAKDGGAKT